MQSFDLGIIVEEFKKKKLFQAHWNWFREIFKNAFRHRTAEDRIYLATKFLLLVMQKDESLHPLGHFIFNKLCDAWGTLPLERRESWNISECGVDKCSAA